MRSRKERGITLIALIVTIIILLILAGVAIVTLTGENGLLERANEAVEKTKEAEAVEVIKLQLISCRMEYTLNSSVDIPTYVEKENKNIETQIDSGNGGDGTPLSNWLMTYEGYEFEIYDLQIQGYYKAGNKIRPTIKDKKVTEEYKFASISGSKVDVEFKVELPTDLLGATVSVNVTSQATGVVNGSYDNTTGTYTGTITTDGTINTNGSYRYEIKATQDGKDYTTNNVVDIKKFLDNPQIEIPESDKKDTELKIKVTNNYPADANISYKYYISETKTFGTEEFTTDTEVIKTGLNSVTHYIKVEAYLSDKTTKVEAYRLSLANSYTINDINFYSFNVPYPVSSKNGPEKAETLFDGIEIQGNYGGNMLGSSRDEIVFSVNRNMTIEAYGTHYSDRRWFDKWKFHVVV